MVSEAMQVSQDAEERVMQKAVWGAFVHYVRTKQAVPSLNSFLKRKAFRFCRVAASRFIYFSSFFKTHFAHHFFLHLVPVFPCSPHSPSGELL